MCGGFGRWCLSGGTISQSEMLWGYIRDRTVEVLAQAKVQPFDAAHESDTLSCTPTPIR